MMTKPIGGKGNAMSERIEFEAHCIEIDDDHFVVAVKAPAILNQTEAEHLAATLTAQLKRAAELEEVVGDKSPRAIKKIFEQAHKTAYFFCWCIENLKQFPLIDGDWREDIKRRLVEHATLIAELAAVKAERDRLCDVANQAASYIESATSDKDTMDYDMLRAALDDLTAALGQPESENQ
jgi:hypothetical protein